MGGLERQRVCSGVGLQLSGRAYSLHTNDPNSNPQHLQIRQRKIPAWYLGELLTPGTLWIATDLHTSLLLVGSAGFAPGFAGTCSRPAWRLGVITGVSGRPKQNGKVHPHQWWLCGEAGMCGLETAGLDGSTVWFWLKQFSTAVDLNRLLQQQ